MKKCNYSLLVTLLTWLISSTSFGQDLPTINITFVSEFPSSSNNPQDQESIIRDEIQVLMRNRYNVQMKTIYGDLDPEKIQSGITQAFQDNETDIVVGIGSISSAILAQQKSFPKPTIASLIIDQSLQGVPSNEEGASGVENFAFLQSPFNIQRDIESLYRIYPFKKIGFLGSRYIVEVLPFELEKYFANMLQNLGADFEIIAFTDQTETTLSKIPEDVDAIYILPDFNQLTDAQMQALIEGINEKKLVSSGLLGGELITDGALMGYEAVNNLEIVIPRRIALNILKIADGSQASTLPVSVPTYTKTLLINMATARKIQKFPDFDLMADAILVNLNKVTTDRSLTLEGVIAEALGNNLNIKIAEKGVSIADRDVALARSDYLPQINANTTITALDRNTAQNSFGAQGRVNWIAGGNLSQLILSEPALANIAIQKYLKEGQEFALQEEQLNIVLDVSTAYLQVLQAKKIIDIRQENVAVTRENYDIAQAKEVVGYSGATDLNRFQAELAQNNISLNNAQAQYRQAQFLLNQVLNRPIDEDFNLDEINMDQPLFKVIDPRVLELIDNYGALEKFADFMVDEGRTRLPEIQQIRRTIAAQERLRKSQMRRFYYPTLSLSGSTNYIIDRYRTVPSPLLEGLGGGNAGFVVDVPTWDFGITLSYPIFAGDSRRREIQRSDFQIDQLRDQESLIMQELELGLRISFETAGASFSAVNLSREASDAAGKNFEIIQDSYSQGLANITTLVDAQNVALQTSLEAENAVYQFMIDILNLERLVGYYYLVASPEERDDFYARLNQYISSTQE